MTSNPRSSAGSPAAPTWGGALAYPRKTPVSWASPIAVARASVSSHGQHLEQTGALNVMKRATNKILHRKLVLRREAIAVLKPPQLGKVAAGEADPGSYFWPCNIGSAADAACVV